MDRLDVEIIAHLQKDGTSTNAGIARKVERSEETVRRRLKKLMEDDYVKVVAVPNARKMGYESQVLIGLQVEADKVDAVAEALKGESSISWISVTTGSFDIFGVGDPPVADRPQRVPQNERRPNTRRPQDGDIHQSRIQEAGIRLEHEVHHDADSQTERFRDCKFMKQKVAIDSAIYDK